MLSIAIKNVKIVLRVPVILNPFIKEAFSDDHLQGEGLAIA
jgi:hypothetical protein